MNNMNMNSIKCRMVFVFFYAKILISPPPPPSPSSSPSLPHVTWYSRFHAFQHLYFLLCLVLPFIPLPLNSLTFSLSLSLSLFLSLSLSYLSLSRIHEVTQSDFNSIFVYMKGQFPYLRPPFTGRQNNYLDRRPFQEIKSIAIHMEKTKHI